MDSLFFIMLVMLFVVFCLICAISVWCCRGNGHTQKGTVYGLVPTATQVTQPPYPVGPTRQPQPAPGFAIDGHHQIPYRLPIGTGYPSSQAEGYRTVNATTTGGCAPYPAVPPYSVGTSSAPDLLASGSVLHPRSGEVEQLPPSYAEAISQPPVEGFTRQAPYNPQY